MEAAPRQADELVGTTFCERYKIIDVLGGGGMGKVYHAQHLLMQRPVAIKILHAKLSNSVAALKRFRVEAQFASSLSHPNILSIHDFGVSGEGNPYMVMDYLEGENLTTLLESKTRLSAVRAINIFTQICSALGHAHAKGIIHRDVKPSNIMLVPFENRRDFVKIVDFGIAKFLDSEGAGVEQLTRTGEIFGSPLYMSPEQCRGKELDTRADIYSLGAVMYLALTGKPIFSTSAALETMFKHVQEMPATFSQVSPDADIPATLETVVFRCLEKEPDRRYQRMADVKEALESVLPAPGVSQPIQPMVVTAGTANALAESSIDTKTSVQEQTVVEQALEIEAPAQPSLPEMSSQSNIYGQVKIAIISGVIILFVAIGALVMNTLSPKTPNAGALRLYKPLVPVIVPGASPLVVPPLKVPVKPELSIPPQSGEIDIAPQRTFRKSKKAVLRVKRLPTYQNRKTAKSSPRPTGLKRLKNSIRNFLNRL
ncbi:MAG: serine/threonine protein kinase [Leptolyngbya sp.]|nr:serine/threonine protein kinase [Candidatus Melainabacteria bacterium]